MNENNNKVESNGYLPNIGFLLAILMMLMLTPSIFTRLIFGNTEIAKDKISNDIGTVEFTDVNLKISTIEDTYDVNGTKYYTVTLSNPIGKNITCKVNIEDEEKLDKKATYKANITVKYLKDIYKTDTEGKDLSKDQIEESIKQKIKGNNTYSLISNVEFLWKDNIIDGVDKDPDKTLNDMVESYNKAIEGNR